jgi:hypothetical protein
VKKIALFVAGLAGAFLAAFLVGRALDVGERTVADEAHGAGHETPALPGGLSLEQDGYRVVAERDELSVGRAEPYVFRILDPDGDVLRDYDLEHERRLHLIVVSRPLDQFLHVHPRQLPDGAWTVPLALPESGSYRVFADFTTDGERRTLGVDLQGRGAATAPRALTRYDVSLGHGGHGDELEFEVSDRGKPVELQRYLGARGHLVVLREGDLAYIHAHADEDKLSFDVPFPSAGSYKLFLQFKVAGAVETASLEVQR